MKNQVKISLLLSLDILCFSMIELKDPGLFGSMGFVLTYAVYNLLFAAGIALFGFFHARFSALFSRRWLLGPVCLLFGALTVAALLSTSAVVYLGAMYCSILFSGVIGGAVYHAISLSVPKWRRGRVIGAGLLGGTLIQYFVELFRNQSGNFYPYLYAAVFLLVSAAFFLLLPGNAQSGPASQAESRESAEAGGLKLLFPILLAATAIICYLSSIYEGVMATVSTGELSGFEVFLLRNTKLMYCASLAAAGLIADLKGRHYISAITIAVMTFLIFNVFLLYYPAVAFINWIILFSGAGFLAMFVMLNFIDLAGLTKRPALWAGGGRILKHSVTAFGSVAGAVLWSRPDSGYVFFVLQYLILLIALIFLLFRHYRLVTKTENPAALAYPSANQAAVGPPPAGPREPSRGGPAWDGSKYDLTDREKQVLGFILTGAQIKEIAKELYVTERTVKFHITNILKKTGCRNQRELISSFANDYFLKQR